jgi:glycosyltransferase involved in cell wall biosynthesis
MASDTGSDPVAPGASRWPAVDVVIPVRNEAASLPGVIAAVLAQDYPGELSVVLGVAPSTDGTEAVAATLSEAAVGHVEVRMVANPAGTTPAGLNAAIRAGHGEVIVRVDGHAELSPGYIRRAVETLRRTAAVNVGGIQRAVGASRFEQAVAAAMSSKFGTGDATFHYGGTEGPTDTVYLGVFDRRALEAVGLFDERLIRNQDYELNIRLRDAGGIVWFDPQLEVRYRPRGSLRALARQYFEYGHWKRVVLRQHPGSLRWRQAVPPIATAAVAAASLAGLWWRPALFVPAGYATAVVAAAARTPLPISGKARLLAIFPAMHLSWGAGFLSALVPTERRGRRVPTAA